MIVSEQNSQSVEEIVLLLVEMDVELDGIRNALVISLSHNSTFFKNE